MQEKKKKEKEKNIIKIKKGNTKRTSNFCQSINKFNNSTPKAINFLYQCNKNAIYFPITEESSQ